MKAYYIFLHSLIFLSTNLLAEDYNLPKTLKVISTALSLKEAKGDRRAFIAEYIPANETFDNWTNMFAVRFVDGKDLDPKGTAENTHKNIQERKGKGDPYANSMVLVSPDKQSVVVDFLVSDKNFLEHNIWRYFKKNGGLVSYQIARRIYEMEKATDFIKSIQTNRANYLKEITRADLPLPDLK